MRKLFFIVVTCLFFLLATFLVHLAYAGFGEGVKKYTTGDYEGAIPEFESALEKDRENEKIKRYLITCLLTVWDKYRQEKKYEKAIYFLKKLCELFPEDPRLKEFYNLLKERVIVKETPLPSQLKVKLRVLAGSVVKMKGKVYYQPKGENLWLPAEVNSPVYPGDKVKTGENSDCEIVFDDGTALRVETNSQVTLNSIMADDTLNLKRFDVGVEVGRVLSNLEKFARPESKFEMRTPSVVVGVRGTKFTADIIKDRTTTVAVFEGTVIVAPLTAPGEEALGINLGEGKQTIVKPGEEPSIIVDLSKEFLDYKTRVVPVFDESVALTRREIDKIILQRAEWVKKKKEKVLLEKMPKAESIDFLLYPMVIEKINFTAEQLKSLKKLKENLRKEEKRKQVEINLAEAELKKLLTAEELNLAEVEIKLRQISNLRAGLRYIGIATFEKGRALLTAEQKIKLGELTEKKIEHEKVKTK